MASLMETRRRIMLNTPHLETLTDSLVSFDTDVPADLKEHKLYIEPIQDLHGYDHPWPAGGGKNLLSLTANSQTVNGVSFTVNNDGTISVNGTATGNIIFQIGQYSVEAGTYVLSGCPQGGSNRTFYIDWRTVEDTQMADTGDGSTYTFEEASGVKNSRLIVLSGTTISNLVFKPMIRKSTDSATFEPYSNICPISGRTGVEVVKCRKNLVDITTPEKNGYYNANGIYSNASSLSCFKIRVTPETTYTISGNFAGIVTYWDANMEYLSGINQGSGFSKTFITPPNCMYIRQSIVKTAIDGTQMLELGSTATSYEPYQAESYDITFPSEAGTVYGGTLDLKSGELVVDRRIITLTGNETFSSGETSGYYYFDSNYVYDVEAWQTRGVACSHAITDDYAYTGIYSLRCQFTGYKKLRFASAKASDAPITTLEELLEFLSNQYNNGIPVQVCYKLATPVTYQLTPHTLKTLRGVNNFWSSAYVDTQVRFWTHKKEG